MQQDVFEKKAQTGDTADAAVINPWMDWLARISVAIVFCALVILNLIGIRALVPLDTGAHWLMLASRLSSMLFLGLIAATALTRLKPVMKSEGIEPRISALAGTFLSFALAALPRADLGPFASAAASTLILVGATLSFIVLRWLGKSFSILAEARRLVTAGPYAIVRHPLYICEGLAIAGAVLQVLSPLAILIAAAVAAFQYRRMLIEEAVLRSAFPEYRDYAARTPRWMPTSFRSRRQVGVRPVGDR